MKTLVKVLVLLATLSSASACFADGNEAVQLVKAAAAYYQANGMEKTLDALNDAKGQFVKGDLYVFAYDVEGNMLANSLKQSLVGQNVIDVPDSKGKKFRREIVERAKKGESGWVDYVAQHPKTKEMELKTTYFEKAGDLVLGCGTYKK
jgi:cytochrome c